MSHRRTVSRRSSQYGGFDPIRSSPESEPLMVFNSKCRRCLISITAMVTMIMVGSVNGWTTISLHYLITGTGGVPLTITHDESSWMVSLTVLGSMIGSLVAAQFVACSDSNICLVLCNTMFTLGWFITYDATSAKILYLARVVLGIAVGIGSTVNPMYLSEIVDTKIIGISGFLIAANTSIGSVVIYTLGLWMIYKSLLLVLVILSFICFLSVRCFTATRYFSVTTDQIRQARQSMGYSTGIENTRGEEIELPAPRAQTRYELHQQSRSELPSQSTRDLTSQSISALHSEVTSEVLPQPTGQLPLQPSRELHSQSTSELHQPSTSELCRPSTSEIHPEPTSEIHPEPTSEIHPLTRRELHRVNIPIKYTWSTKLLEILRQTNRKALFIMLGLIMAQQLSGNFITMQYLHVLFSKTTIRLQPHEATMLVLGVDCISGSLSHLQVESHGRRKLLILSTLGSCFTLSILATYLLLDQLKFDVSNVSILPVIDLMIYQVVFHIGLGTLPNVLLCELFPAELKGFVGAIIVIFDGIIGFTVSKLYQVTTDNVGLCAIYFIFATSCFLAFAMVYIWLPETKGKTYHEIKALLVGEYLNSLTEEVRTDEMDISRI